MVFPKKLPNVCRAVLLLQKSSFPDVSLKFVFECFYHSKRMKNFTCLCLIGEFWLGLKKIYAIAHQGNSLLHVQMEDWRKEKHFMVYQYILEDAASNFTIHLKLQWVEASSAVDEHIGLRFSTKDHNDGNLDPNCAQDYTGILKIFSSILFMLVKCISIPTPIHC